MKQIAIKYGLWMFLGFTTLFLLMHIAGLSRHPNLRVLTVVVYLALLYFAIRDFRRQKQSEYFYLSRVAFGMYSSMIGVAFFACFQMLFLDLPHFMAHLQTEITTGATLNPITASFFILVKVIAISVIGFYIITRVIDAQLTRPCAR